MVGEHVDVCVRERGRQADSEFTGRLQEAPRSPPSEFISLWSEVQVKWAPEVRLVTSVKTVLRTTEPWTCWVQDRLQVVSLRIDVDSDFALQQSVCLWVSALMLTLTVLLQCVCCGSQHWCWLWLCVTTVCVLVGRCVHPAWSFLSFLLYGFLVFNKFGNVLLFLWFFFFFFANFSLLLVLYFAYVDALNGMMHFSEAFHLFHFFSLVFGFKFNNSLFSKLRPTFEPLWWIFNFVYCTFRPENFCLVLFGCHCLCPFLLGAAVLARLLLLL